MKIAFLVFTILVNSLSSHGQDKLTTAQKFIDFLNTYQKDSLQGIITDDFKLVRTYSDFVNDKAAFLDDYLTNSKAYNGKYKILRVINNLEPIQLLVEDHSDYFKYLKIENPQWTMTFTSAGNKIRQVSIDTTATYSRFLADTKKKNAEFDNWLSQKHPGLEMDTIVNTEGLLMKLLKEYSKENE